MLIQLDRAIINNNELTVTGNSTAFVTESRGDIPSVKSVQDKLKSVIKLARAKDIKLKNQKAAKDKLASLADTTPELTDKYHALFDALVAFWEGKVDMANKTIPNYSSEAVKDGYKLAGQIRAMFYGTEPLDQLLTLSKKLNSIEEKLNHIEDACGTTLYL